MGICMGFDLADAVLAVDGGGTRLRLVLEIGETQLVASGGPCNLSSDFDGGIRVIKDGLTGIVNSSGMAETEVHKVAAYLAIAGVIDDKIAAKAKAELPLTHVRIEDDRHAAISGALEKRDGAVAHCGTGSFLGKQTAGQTRVVGGWGARLGDEASAHWIASRALSLSLDAHDGLTEPTELSHALLRKLNGPGGVVAFARKANAGEMAAIAPEVSAAADAGDRLGAQVMTEGAAYLEATLARIGWNPGDALCLTGGAAPAFGAYLKPETTAGRMEPRGKPIDGAIALARKFKEETK